MLNDGYFAHAIAMLAAEAQGQPLLAKLRNRWTIFDQRASVSSYCANP